MGFARGHRHGRQSVYSRAIFLIIITEFCERYSFCGLRTILSLYLRDVLLYHESPATVIYHVFIMMCYFVTVFGAVIADSYLGRFKTIMYFSLLYALGNVILSTGAIPPLHLPSSLMTILGLTLIAAGTGGIKPCVAAFGGDQFRMPEQQEELKHFFSIFYFMINFGGFAGMLTTPILRKAVHCFGDDSCYALGFGLPAGLMILSFFFFVSGKSWYRMKTPKEKIMVQFIKCAGHAVIKKVSSKKLPKRSHWLDYSAGKYDDKLIQDMKTVLAILFLFTPLPLFWSLFDQQGSRWTFQASRTNTKLCGFHMIPDQMQIINPVIVLILIPVFEKSLYPWWDKIGIFRTPLQKMIVGGFIASISFVAAGIVELKLQETYPTFPQARQSTLHCINMLPCEIQVVNPFNKIQSIRPGEKYEFKGINSVNSTKYSLEVIAPYRCGSMHLESPEKKVEVTLKEHKIQSIVVAATHNTIIEVFNIPNEDLHKSLSGKPKLRVIIISEPLLERMLIVTLQGDDLTKTISNINTPVHLSPYFEIDSGMYRYEIKTRSGMSLHDGEMLLEVGGVYSLIVQEKNPDAVQSKVVTMTSANTIHLLCLVPQYLLISIGEVMFAIAGLQFTFTQAPKSMKTITIAAWYLTVALGNLIVIIVAKLNPFKNQAKEFFFFAALVFLDNLLFIILVGKYKMVCMEADDSTTLFCEEQKSQIEQMNQEEKEKVDDVNK